LTPTISRRIYPYERDRNSRRRSQTGRKDKNEFLSGLGEIDFHDAWDRQIDTDIKAGKLDGLAEEALAERRISA